jgi:MoaA/NifB/PqqE/SkfB family radical SAM enzyme
MPASIQEPADAVGATSPEMVPLETAVAGRSDHQRGAGEAMAHATFRDPAGLDAEIAALQLDVARALLNAPSLPVEFPAFNLSLLSVAADRASIDLVMGKRSPVAKLRLVRAAADQAVLAGTENGLPTRRPAVEVTVVALHPDCSRFQRQLLSMQERLRAAITVEKWDLARIPAKRLALIPVGVPLPFYRQLVPGIGGQGLVRTGFNCNQDCGICWQDRTWGRFGSEQVLTWIEDLYTGGARRLIISGGEPTLDVQLESYIRRACELGFNTVTLETNAIQFSKPGLAERLRDAGLTDCFVSLHSGDAKTSDAITRAPGTFTRTVAGIKALLAAAVPVRLNCVMTREGIDHLEGVPDFVHAELGAHPHLNGLMLSQPTDPYDRSLLPKILPEPDRLRAVLSAVIERAFALGVPVSGLDGPCGPPLCAFGADRRITALTPITEHLEGRTYLAACAGCAVRNACFGVRVADVELYGDACVRPLAVPPAA